MSGPWRMLLADVEFARLLELIEATELPIRFWFAVEGLTVETHDEDAAAMATLAFGCQVQR